jgi:hypothetical protein
MELSGGPEDGQKSPDTELPSRKVQARATKDLSVPLHHHPPLQVRVERAHVGSETGVLPPVDGLTDLFPLALPLLPVIRGRPQGSGSGYFPPIPDGVEGHRIS